jgi:S-adenosylmethionine hydrolase
MKPNNIITLLTDFGETDGFVGTMKGVILSINPNATIVDISHEIPAQDIEAGAFVLNNSYRYFPPGTIHVAVVDPGVGSERKILAVQSDNYFFIAPDNQVLKYIFHSSETLKVVEVLNKEFFLNKISRTFHGRDIFAPVAAHISIGVGIEQLGNQTINYDRGTIDQPIITKSRIIGRIIYSDKFGNLITNIAGEMIDRQISMIQIGSTKINHLSCFYSEVDVNQPVAIIGSSGYLEIAIRNGNASRQLFLDRGEIVTIEF